MVQVSRRTRERFREERSVIRFLNGMTVDSFMDGRSVRESREMAPRDAWIEWLRPHFADNRSAYFTGTYCDSYGYDNGLMLVRNVQRDFERFIDGVGRCADREFVCGVEPHKYRDVLHLHAIIEGPFSSLQLEYLKASWENGGRYARRGFAKALPVLDGCESYVTKYALKGDSDAFSFRLSRLSGLTVAESHVDSVWVQGCLSEEAAS